MTVLSAADHDRFVDQGCLYLPGLVPRDVVDAAFADLEARLPDHGKGLENDGHIDYPAALACVTPELVSAVNEIFGPEHNFEQPASVGYHPRRYEPDAHWGQHGHVDLVHPVVLPEAWAIGAFIFLTKVRHKGGAFFYAPGSPRGLAAAARQNSPDAVWGEANAERYRDMLVECLAEPGDVLLFHYLMCHSASMNVSDPVTRHALDMRFTPQQRVVPGDKPFDVMTTLERSCSARYLAHRFEGPGLPPVVDGSEADDQLRRGYEAPGGVVAHTTFRHDGWIYLLVVGADEPALIQPRRTRDWVRWDELSPWDPGCGPVRGLHVDHRFAPVLTVGAEETTSLFGSEDGTSWRALVDVSSSTGKGYFVHADPERQHILHSTTGTSVTWRRGADLGEAPSWTEAGVAYEPPAPLGALRDPWVVTGTPEGVALVFDAPDACYVPGASWDAFQGDPRPFCLASGDRVRQLRVHDRGHCFWLVTYVRDEADGARVHLGTIDWFESPGVIREIRDGAALRKALEMVGLL